MKVINLNKSFDGNIVFKDANFLFEKGKITYLMGNSGCGKTTLLRILTGLDKDYTGEVIYEGRIAYVFQEPRLFPNLTSLENIKVVNDNPSIDANELLNLVELNDSASLYPSQLSGGMKMRLSLARALYSDSDIYFFDEPFSSLDAEMKERIASKVFDLLKGKTIIIVSHDITEANRYGDYILNIKKTD